jgi:hypothetical protein
VPDWSARRIARELADAERRRALLVAFWRHADAGSRLAAQAFLAKAFNVRPATLGKMPPERKAELLAARLGAVDCEAFVEAGLLQHHLHHAKPLMAAFLDHWGIAHDDGEIKTETPQAPESAAVRDAVSALAGSFDRADVRLYLASAGLLMGEDWRAATWPVVDEMG